MVRELNNFEWHAYLLDKSWHRGITKEKALVELYKAYLNEFKNEHTS